MRSCWHKLNLAGMQWFWSGLKKRNASLASISDLVSTQVLNHTNHIIKFRKSLEHQQNMPLTFFVGKDLKLFIVLGTRKVGAVGKSLTLAEKLVSSLIPVIKCSLPVLAAAGIPYPSHSSISLSSAGNLRVLLSPQNAPILFPRLIIQDLRKAFFLSNGV